MRTGLRLARTLVALAAVAIPLGCGGDGEPSLFVSTLAGSNLSGTTDGTGNAARFNNPVNVALDSQGNLYICDFDNNRIRRVTPQGVVTTVTVQANFARPFGITFTPDNQLYVQTDANDQGARDNTTGTLWRINLASGEASLVLRNLGRPRGLTALPDGRLVLVDNEHHFLRLLNLTTLAITHLAGVQDTPGYVDATGGTAQFNRPYGAAVTPQGNILVADQNNNRLRLVTPQGVVTTFAGDGTAGYRDGVRLQAQFNRPQDVAIDSAGNVYVSDNGNHRIRKIDTSGNVTTVAGTGSAGFADGEPSQAAFFGQEGIAVTPDGTTLYVADGTGGEEVPYHRVRRINLR